MSQHPGFLFVTSQVGAERAVKSEIERHWPDFRFAFSRPGFMTFKLPQEKKLYADFDLQSVFARSYGFSLGQVEGDDPDALGRQVWQLYGERPVRRLHVWARDEAPPGQHATEPTLLPIAAGAREAIGRHCPRSGDLADGADDFERPAERGEFVLDCIIVEPNRWWVGYHRAAAIASRWPGGVIPLEVPPHAVSRAWLKMEEGLRWSELPMTDGARCVEIGSAPGGASQALLDRGFEVTGVDPAAMAPEVLAHPKFRHIRRRVSAVRRRDLRKVRWLTADMNVAPSYTLDVVESIVTHPEVRIRGMLITLKLSEWKLAEQMTEFLERIRSWGYNEVRARQLFHNRQEVCVAALQRPFSK